MFSREDANIVEKNGFSQTLKLATAHMNSSRGIDIGGKREKGQTSDSYRNAGIKTPIDVQKPGRNKRPQYVKRLTS